jgi:hypothetical protein
LKKAEGVAEAVDMICAAVVAKTYSLGMIPEESIDSSNSISHYGINSLVTVEMRNSILDLIVK